MLKFHPFFPLMAMSSLYRDPQWSTKINRVISRLLDSGVGTWQRKNFSLTDMWGVLTSAGEQVHFKEVYKKLQGTAKHKQQTLSFTH